MAPCTLIKPTHFASTGLSMCSSASHYLVNMLRTRHGGMHDKSRTSAAML